MVYGRRALLGLAVAGTGVGAAAALLTRPTSTVAQVRDVAHDDDAAPAPRRPSAAGQAHVREENARAGSDGWRHTRGLRPSDDIGHQVQGYADASSVAPGGTISFHVSARTDRECRIEVYRLGHYGGRGGRLMQLRAGVPVALRPAPANPDRRRSVACRWPASWRLAVPRTWPSGLYVAVFATGTHRAAAPFVVRDPQRAAALCVVVPTATYQAYNLWPDDRVRGRSLYRGVDAAGAFTPGGRAAYVSFDRPYRGEGLPFRFGDDVEFVRWGEEAGYDLAYATSEDLHRGRVDVRRYRGLVFSGHDEYWTAPMRRRVEEAVADGTSLAFLSANNIYWHVRLVPAAVDAGRADRVVGCAKSVDDPGRGHGAATGKWRQAAPAPAEPEQRLTGTQYRSVVRGAAPLVVRAARHWLWRDCGVRAGTRIPHVVVGEADSFDERVGVARSARHTLVSASPYPGPSGRRWTQHTSVRELANGAVVFTAGTFGWTRALGPGRFGDPRIQQATRNLLDRICLGPA
ncbi:N,N-dimethylformamidase beta subunit family domain-containing protein [Pilimelia terevasa]|uniref:N,N-dimethylformamidase beta subunit family domain-containing protein n=1 Tax=Pilimelia terevasa TaxID=53372 RepID=UPI00166C6925|nr:N,N-dimethylformamidase beta subunit family domain-containing protein [Pilimelia terevasa]